jgi:hypothetical protein
MSLSAMKTGRSGDQEKKRRKQGVREPKKKGKGKPNRKFVRKDEGSREHVQNPLDLRFSLFDSYSAFQVRCQLNSGRSGLP